jgi:Putative peptidoglycan binding domain
LKRNQDRKSLGLLYFLERCFYESKPILGVLKVAGSHTVKQGEHISGIAEHYGFRDYHTIWNDSHNQELKQQRKDPHVLYPGDALYIPDKVKRTEDRPSGKTHVFQVASKKLMLRLKLHDFDNVPMPNMKCELEVDGRKYQLTSDGDGMIKSEISKTVENGMLRVPDLELELPLKIGHLDPHDQDSGWMARLINLGYVPKLKSDSDAPQLSYAIEEFQCDQKLKVTGEMDDATRNKLKELHGL